MFISFWKSILLPLISIFSGIFICSNICSVCFYICTHRYIHKHMHMDIHRTLFSKKMFLLSTRMAMGFLSFSNCSCSILSHSSPWDKVQISALCVLGCLPRCPLWAAFSSEFCIVNEVCCQRSSVWLLVYQTGWFLSFFLAPCPPLPVRTKQDVSQ